MGVLSIVIALLIIIIRELKKLHDAGGPVSPPLVTDEVQKSSIEKENVYIKTLYFPPDSNIKLIGFKTIHIEKESVPGFNNFYSENKESINSITNHFYYPKTAQMRVYFPVRSAIVDIGDKRLEASEHGSLKLDSDTGLELIRIIGRKQTEKITGVETNVLKDEILFLATPAKVDHIINSNVLIFDFGEREITSHHDHSHVHGELSAKVGCLPNHGGVNCTIAFGVGQGRCPFNPAVCMDYNGVFTDCVNYGSGWKRYRNFILSDCDYAMGQGHCWNEV